MPKNQKMMYVLIISFLFVFSVGSAGAAMHSSAGGPTGTPPPNQTQVTKSAQFVKAIANNVLYLENNTSYDLSGVKVIDRTGTSRVSKKKIMAELMLMNGVLKEVILR